MGEPFEYGETAAEKIIFLTDLSEKEVLQALKGVEMIKSEQ